MSKRSIIGNVSMAVGLTVAGCMEPWILRALGDWKLLMPILFAQGAVIFITPWQVCSNDELERNVIFHSH